MYNVCVIHLVGRVSGPVPVPVPVGGRDRRLLRAAPVALHHQPRHQPARAHGQVHTGTAYIT